MGWRQAVVLLLVWFAMPAAALTPGTDVLVPAAARAGSWVTDLYVLNPAWGEVLLVGNFNETDYEAIVVELLRRFHDDWAAGRLPSDQVLVVRYDRLMKDFEGIMGEILDFVGHEPDEALREAIRARAESQRASLAP